jgi:hypothetical protein
MSTTAIWNFGRGVRFRGVHSLGARSWTTRESARRDSGHPFCAKDLGYHLPISYIYRLPKTIAHVNLCFMDTDNIYAGSASGNGHIAVRCYTVLVRFISFTSSSLCYSCLSNFL